MTPYNKYKIGDVVYFNQYFWCRETPKKEVVVDGVVYVEKYRNYPTPFEGYLAVKAEVIGIAEYNVENTGVLPEDGGESSYPYRYYHCNILEIYAEPEILESLEDEHNDKCGFTLYQNMNHYEIYDSLGELQNPT